MSKRLDRPGNFYPVSALAGIPQGAPAYLEEVFGPVALLFKVQRLDPRRGGTPALRRRAGSGRDLHQCDGGLGPAPALRRRQALRLWARAFTRRHPRINAAAAPRLLCVLDAR